MENILETRDLTKKFGEKIAVDHVNVTLEQGDIYGLIGKNGAGKTTFMRMVLSLAFPTSGHIKLFGGKDFASIGCKVGSLIEEPGLYKNCNARENLKRFALLYGQKDAPIDELLELVGLADVGKKKAGKFSLGMRQRLGIAIALLGDPELMILDEPMNGLDPTGMKEIRDLIIRLNQERKITFMISSHLLDELSKVVTKYGIVNDGKMVEELSADELENRRQHRLVITVDDVEKSVTVLESIMAKEEIKTQDNTIVLNTHLDEGAKLNQILSKNDILVSGIELKSDGLEEYFIERMGEE